MEKAILDLRSYFEQKANPLYQVYMQHYRADKFLFFGVTRPEIKKMLTSYFNRSYLKNNKVIDREFLLLCYYQPEREFYYLASEYLIKYAKLIYPDDIYFLIELVLKKPFWDTVDNFAMKILSPYCMDHLEVAEYFVLPLQNSENLWYRRLAILMMLRWKDKTNIQWLSEVIYSNIHSSELIINRAIGWILRDYSKTNREWVLQYLNDNYAFLDKIILKEVGESL